jgi:membrane protease subunit HflK
MREIDRPSEVFDACRDVQCAGADKEIEINQAQAYSNDILPRAKGVAEKILQGAEAYKQEVIARAEGESDRFIAIHAEYLTAKQVTKQRMYLEAMEEILKGMDKIVIDSKVQGSGVLPYLPLSALQKNSDR